MNKNVATRVLAWVLVIALVLGLASSLLVYVSGATTVNYVTGSSDKYSNIIANWGQREELATFLSPKAEAFYTAGNTYDDFKNLTDSNSSTEYNDGLYSALQKLMQSRHKSQTSYDATKGLYPFTDCENSDYKSSGAISCFYTGNGLGPGWDGGSTWNREHTWPNSKSPTGNSENDIMMLRPTSSKVNSGRGNTAYGESGSYYDPNNESNGKHDLHGDVARIVLYVYVRWGLTKAEGASSIWGTKGVMESKDVLLRWMKEDPVDTWEMGRNDSVQSITGTRNVFVDYPELAYTLFNQQVPDMKTPSGEAENQNSSNYTITAVSANTSLGTVAVSGNNITVTPKTGYKLSRWEVTQGSATVTQNGNTLKVNATSDCTVTVYFAALGMNGITFVENGTSVASTQVYDGETLVMPQLSNAAPDNYAFLGWVTAAVNHQQTKPAQIFKAGEAVVPTGNTVYYALYQYADPNASGNSGVFEQHSGPVVPGNYLIVSDGVAMSAVINSGGRFELGSQVSDSDGRITEVAANCIWKFEEISTGVFTLYNESVGKYAAGTGVKNKGQMLSDATDTLAHWEITDETDPYVIECVGNRTASVNYTLRRNGSYGFAPYSTTTGTVTSLYKEAAGGVVYTTSSYTEDMPGDVDGDFAISDADAIYLLRFTLFPSRYPLNGNGDVNSDGNVSDADAIYLLRYTLFPDRFPLFPGK